MKISCSKKIGSLDSIFKMIPGFSGIREKIQAATNAMPEKELVKVEAIISSMTVQERQNPDILNGSRRARIARGAGVTVTDVNRLVKQFEDMRKMMKSVMGGKQKRPAIPGLGQMNLPGMAGMGLPPMPDNQGSALRFGSSSSSSDQRKKKKKEKRKHGRK